MNKTSVFGKLAATALLAAPYLASAQGVGLGGATPFAGTAQQPLDAAIFTIVNILLTIAGLIAALYLIYGGVRYITSQGEEKTAEEAKKTIIYALLGLIIIGLAAVTVNFIVSAISRA